MLNTLAAEFDSLRNIHIFPRIFCVSGVFVTWEIKSFNGLQCALQWKRQCEICFRRTHIFILHEWIFIFYFFLLLRGFDGFAFPSIPGIVVARATWIANKILVSFRCYIEVTTRTTKNVPHFLWTRSIHVRCQWVYLICLVAPLYSFQFVALNLLPYSFGNDFGFVTILFVAIAWSLLLAFVRLFFLALRFVIIIYYYLLQDVCMRSIGLCMTSRLSR